MSTKAVEREEAAATPRSSVARLSFGGGGGGKSRANALADVNNALADVNITLASLPEYVQEKLKAFDVDGDGFISLAEILRHGAELEQSKQHVAVRHQALRRAYAARADTCAADLAVRSTTGA